MNRPVNALLPYPKLPGCAGLPSQRSGLKSEGLSKSASSLRKAMNSGTTIEPFGMR
ncbi:hypothetical protein M3J09_006194 [Ascochyta lentis]